MVSTAVIAVGRPPTTGGRRSRASAHHERWLSAGASVIGYNFGYGIRRNNKSLDKSRLLVHSEPTVTESAIDFAREALDTDFKEVLDSVKASTEAAALSTQDAIQETAAAVGVTAAAVGATFKGKLVQGLSGPVRAMILLNLGSALFGSNQVALKMTEGSMTPNAISAIRFLFAAAVFFPSILRGVKIPALRENAVELGLWLFGGYMLQAIGLQSTSAAHGSFTGTIMVLIVPLLVGLSGRKVATSTWVASLVALFGVGLLTTSDANPNSGDALCVLSAVLFGIHKWKSESSTARFSENTQELVAVQLATLAAASCVSEAPTLANLVTHNSAGELLGMAGQLPWPLLAYMGLATTAFTLWVEINALKKWWAQDISAPLAALIYTSEPLWGAFFAWTLLGEHWGPMGWLGAFLIVAATLAAQLNTGGSASKEEKATVKVEVYGTSNPTKRVE